MKQQSRDWIAGFFEGHGFGIHRASNTSAHYRIMISLPRRFSQYTPIIDSALQHFHWRFKHKKRLTSLGFAERFSHNGRNAIFIDRMYHRHHWEIGGEPAQKFLNWILPALSEVNKEKAIEVLKRWQKARVRRFTTEEKIKLRNLLPKVELSTKEIARRADVSTASVSRYRRIFNIPGKKKNLFMKGGTTWNRLSPPRIRKIYWFWNQGYTIVEIARKVKISDTTVKKYLYLRNLKRRNS